MESFRTLYRLVVMSAAAVIAYIGWQHFGVPADRLKSLARQAIDVAQRSLDENRPANGSATLASDPASVAPQFAQQSVSPGPIAPAATSAPVQQSTVAPASLAAPALIAGEPPPGIGPVAGRVETPAPEAKLVALYARLDQLGVHKRQLVDWGENGLHRFTCAAAVVDTPRFSRHFEAIAPEPQMAVEQVLAKVEAWRASQQRPAQSALQ
jgi:hypothetical protein